MQFPTLDFLWFLHPYMCYMCWLLSSWCVSATTAVVTPACGSESPGRPDTGPGTGPGHEMITKWSRRSWSAHIAHGLCWMLDLLKSVCQSLSAPHFAGKKGKSKAGATAGDFVVTLWAHFGGSKVRGQCTNVPMDPQNWLWTQLWSNVFNCI